jgi:hypothetical protein
VNCLPLSVITSSGAPWRANPLREGQAHRPGGRPFHDRRHHAVARVAGAPPHTRTAP